jgi:hypothetical protein
VRLPDQLEGGRHDEIRGHIEAGETTAPTAIPAVNAAGAAEETGNF